MYTVDEGLHGRNVLQSVSIESATDILYICSRSIHLIRNVKLEL